MRFVARCPVPKGWRHDFVVRARVSAVVAVSHELGFRVVAEGVETEEQAQRLLDLGCDHGQGYLFGRPVPIGEGPWW